MIRIAPPEHYAWIAERADVTITPQFRAIESVDASGRILGMIGYDGWTENAGCMHIALEFPAAFRSLLQHAFRMLFLDHPLGAGKRIAVCTVMSNNARSLRLVEHVGFREVYRGREWRGRCTCGATHGKACAPDCKRVDLVWHEMRREECRWIPKEARQ